jgi:arthrofactin-type cyclic lipopeptide synthetase C
MARPVRSLSQSPLVQVMFTWQDAREATLELASLEVEPLKEAPGVHAKFDLALTLQEVGESIVGGLEYATSLLERSTVECYLGHLRTLLKHHC